MNLSELMTKASEAETELKALSSHSKLSEMEAVSAINLKYEKNILPAVKSMNTLASRFDGHISRFVSQGNHSGIYLHFDYDSKRLALHYSTWNCGLNYILPVDGEDIIYKIDNEPKTKAILWFVNDWESILQRMIDEVSGWIDYHTKEQEKEHRDQIGKCEQIKVNHNPINADGDEVCSVEWIIMRSPDGSRWLWSPSSSRFDIDFDKFAVDYDTCGFSTDCTNDEIKQYLFEKE